MLRRRALVAGLASFFIACGGPRPSPTPAPAPTTPPELPPRTPAPTAPPEPTSPPAPVVPSSTPTGAPAATSEVPLDVRLWNGEAELQLDGRTIRPGQVMVSRGPHQLAALSYGEVVALADVDPDPEGGRVDLVVPPPQAGLAVMIENQEDARPQTGLTQADVVYEALAEGGITRFIGIFLAGDAPVVGPVRSLRHYFAFMAGDYGADVVHIGASPEGFAWRDAMDMGHLDEAAGEPGVWRVRTRRAPHNAYTGTFADRGFLREQGRQQHRSWGPLLFHPEPARGVPTRGLDVAETVTLGFLPWPYRVKYLWEAPLGRYVRFMEGEPHLDGASHEPIAPATVVVQFTEVERIPDDPKLRLDVNLVGGSGQLMVFSGGTRREGTWSKSSSRSATRWLDAAGERIVIPRGPVWVEVLPLDSPLSWE